MRLYSVVGLSRLKPIHTRRTLSITHDFTQTVCFSRFDLGSWLFEAVEVSNDDSTRATPGLSSQRAGKAYRIDAIWIPCVEGQISNVCAIEYPKGEDGYII